MKNVLKIVSKRLSLGAGAFVLAASAVVAPLTAASIVRATSAVSMEANIKVANVTDGDTSYSNSVDARVDEVVKVQLWYHNREDFDSGKVAQNLRAMIDIPTTQGKSQTITGTVKGDNTNTATDTAQVNLSLDNAYLDYVEGSAKWRYNKGGKDGRAVCQTGNQAVPTNDPNDCYVTEGISDKVVTDEQGLVLEDAQPCFAYEATVTVLARVKASEVKINKYVSAHDGDNNVENNDWKLKNEAKPGDKVDYMIRFENKGNTELRDVMVGDNLARYTSYVEGSTWIYNNNNPDGRQLDNDNLTRGGINVGHYMPGAEGYIVFTAKIDEISGFEKCTTYTLKNVGIVQPEGMNEFYNTAWTTVPVVCEEGEEPETPTTPEKPEEELPEELPSTGPAAVLSGLFGTGAIAAGISNYLRSRRVLKDALNG